MVDLRIAHLHHHGRRQLVRVQRDHEGRPTEPHLWHVPLLLDYRSSQVIIHIGPRLHDRRPTFHVLGGQRV